jgi:hypothetical protein
MDSEKGVRSSSSKPSSGDDDESAAGSCVAGLIWVLSMLMICCTFPFSLCVCMKQIQVIYQSIMFFLTSEYQNTLDLVLFSELSLKIIFSFRNTKEQ